MPIIVPIEDNKVGLATATDAKFRAPDYSGSGLEALGAGLVQLGGGGQQLAGGLQERRRRAAEAISAAMLYDRHQSNIDDAAVKQAYVDYSDPTHEALHGEDGLFTRQGAGAHAAFPGLVEKLVDHHDTSLSKLDDIQRATLAPIMNERLRSDVERAAEHVRQQGVAEQKWQSQQLQKAAARDAANHADDPDLFDHNLKTGENAIRQQAKVENVGDKLLAKQIGDYKSAAHADTIDALAQRDPAHAAGWYARYGDNLNQRDKMRVESTLGPALADARAVADVDATSSAGDPAAAPANPHVGNDATLLLKMQGITPMMDQTALPALMQRYGNDPAKAWAAFEAGPDYLDRLIAQRGDDWYAGLTDDTRRFVGGNMRMLNMVNSARIVPTDITPAAFDANIPFGRPSAGAGMIPASFNRSGSHLQTLPTQRRGNLTTPSSAASSSLPVDTSAPQPRGGMDIGTFVEEQFRQLSNKPAAPLFQPIVSSRIGGDVVLAAKVDPDKVGRLSGHDVVATPAMRPPPPPQIEKVRVRVGDDEIMAFGYQMPDGTIEVRPVPPHKGVGSSGDSDYIHSTPSGPGKAIFVIHGHIEKRKSGTINPSDGMVDNLDVSPGRGDADGLAYDLPVATVYNGYIGWHEMKNGQLLFTVPEGAQTPAQLDSIQQNLTRAQKKFYKKH